MRKIIIGIFVLCCLSADVHAISATIDPLDIGVGTRPLGMGKAFVAAADDINSIFLNPAGLSFARGWGLTSIYSSLFSEVNYLTLGGFFAGDREGWGIGYVGANVGGDILITYRDPVTKRIVPMESFAAGYSSNVLLFSYGAQLGKFFNFPHAEKISVGTSFKLFYQSLKASEESFATGQDLDIGAIYAVNEWFKLGLYGQNILPSDAAGVLVWNSGQKETIPHNYKLGASCKVFGSDAVWDLPQDVYLNLDLEDSFTQGRPTIYHSGIEWWVYRNMALRLGVDQDVYSKMAGVGIDSNVTFGLGLWYQDFGFDYAYHQYGPLSENTTHYFSISYGFPKAPVVQEKDEPYAIVARCFKLIQPKDKSVIRSDFVNVNGETVGPNAHNIFVNNIEATTLIQGDSGLFSAYVPLIKNGKQMLTIKCVNSKGVVMEQFNIRLIKRPSFADIPDAFPAKDAIESLATLGIVEESQNGTFRPDKAISRAELAYWLVKATGVAVPKVKSTEFTDVSGKDWADSYIVIGANRGLVKGYRDKTFRPDNPVTRAEGIVMIASFAGLPLPDKLRESPFPDIPVLHDAAKYVYAARQAGLLDHLSGKNFEPDKPLTRAEAAVILSKTRIIKDKAADIDNWDIGFEQQP